MAIHRYKYGNNEILGFPFLLFYYLKRKYSKISYGQGYGRHSQEEGKK
jgi:hypothetical protein